MMKSINSGSENHAEEKSLSTWQVAVSILASFIGVQKEKTLDRDFSRGKPMQFIIIGVALTVIWYLAIYFVVQLVLKSAT